MASDLITVEREDDDEEAQLMPDRHPQHDLFICDVSDAVLKDVMQHLEHPFYSLSKKPETNIRRYEHNGHYIEITPSVKGLATIYDKDILIYCISQIMQKMKAGEAVSQRVRIVSRDLLIFTNRGTSGRDYCALVEALERLRGTMITTNIKAGGEEQTDTFGLIDASSVRRKHGLDGRLLWCEVKLSDWVFSAIKSHEVLTLHRDYFRLRKPIERRVYEIARKHCGQQDGWKISLPLLLKKTGSQGTEKRFRLNIRHLAQHDHLPDYHVSFDTESDMVIFVNRHTMKVDDEPPPQWEGRLKGETLIEAKRRAPGWDIYVIEQAWRVWLADNEITPNHPDRHFLKFCESWYAKRGRP